MFDNPNYCNWRKAAELLQRKTGANSIHPKVQAFLSSPECKRVLVACSGGADSVYMLCQLWAEAKTFGVELVVAHYNHRWRGVDSEEDAGFVETMARQLKCPFAIGECPENGSAMTETSARALRIDFLRAAAREHDCQCIAFGHQQNDILETQLQRLARGSGTDGLAAPRPVHHFDALPTHIRPLLHLSAPFIREALQAHSIVWREDASNQNIRIPRNALRNGVIPDLKAAVEHDVNKGAARSRMLLEEDAVALDQISRELLPEAFGGCKTLERERLRAVSRAVTRRALIAWLSMHQLSASMSAVAVDRLVDAVYADKANVRLSAGASFVVMNVSTIRIEPADSTVLPLEPCSLKAGESVVLSTGAILETELVSVNEMLRKRLMDGTIDVMHEAYIASAPGQSFQVRSRQAGDIFRPLGAPGNKKIKEWFTDRKISVRERKILPLVLTNSGVVVWAPGFPPANDLKINDTTKTALKLTYKTRKPL